MQSYNHTKSVTLMCCAGLCYAVLQEQLCAFLQLLGRTLQHSC